MAAMIRFQSRSVVGLRVEQRVDFKLNPRVDQPAAIAQPGSDGRVSAPSEVSVHVSADAPVALVDHPRAERPGLDQLQLDVRGNRREERRAATDDDRMAEYAQLIDQAELDRRPR